MKYNNMTVFVPEILCYSRPRELKNQQTITFPDVSLPLVTIDGFFLTKHSLSRTAECTFLFPQTTDPQTPPPFTPSLSKLRWFPVENAMDSSLDLPIFFHKLGCPKISEWNTHPNTFTWFTKAGVFKLGFWDLQGAVWGYMETAKKKYFAKCIFWTS